MTDRYRILVTGSRTWDDFDIVRTALAAAVYQQLPAVIVHGAHPSGADAIASWWVRQIGRNLDITEERHPADRDGLSGGAGLVNLGADVCLAFLCDDSRADSDTADLAERAGIPVRKWTA